MAETACRSGGIRPPGPPGPGGLVRDASGASLTYRYATTAPLLAGALVDVSPLRPGLTRRLASGALKYSVKTSPVSLWATASPASASASRTPTPN